MKTNYLSYAQACALASDYQHLTGEPFNNDYRINVVTVAPYSQILQWAYIAGLLRHPGAVQEFKNPTGRFDVVVVSRCPEAPSGFMAKSLRNYLAEAGIFYNEAHYKSPHCGINYEAQVHRMPVYGSMNTQTT